MSGGIAGLDHLLIGVADLEGAKAAYERLGFRPTPRGRHIGWGTANYCLMFPDDYLELIGIVDPAQFTNNLDAFLAERGEGLLGAAFAAGDLDALKAELADTGVAADGPQDLARILELPEGEARPAFQLLFTPPEATPGLRAFVCRHLTPEIVWRRDWLEHPNGATRVAGLTVVVEDPGAVAVPYADLFGFDAIRNTDNLVEVACGGCRLRFTDADGLTQRHPQAARLAPPRAEGPAAMEIAVRDLAATAKYLNSAGVPADRGRDGRLHLGPGEASGVLVDFV